jgi:hypothetical protein
MLVELKKYSLTTPPVVPSISCIFVIDIEKLTCWKELIFSLLDKFTPIGSLLKLMSSGKFPEVGIY